MERRDFLKSGLRLGVVSAVGLGAGCFGKGFSTQAAWAAEEPGLSPEAALEKLMMGNQRFVQHQPQHPDQSQQRLQEVARSQHPFATILSCADSRVPGEIVFDQGIGDLFDIRVAGNIATPEVLGSIEYAVALLKTPLLMVLGHERCGAVTAAVQQGILPGEIGSLVKAILPVVDRAKAMGGDPVENAVVANVQYQIQQLLRSQILRDRQADNTLKIVGGRYDLDTGRVTLL
jgi:carbonic anhydrase